MLSELASGARRLKRQHGDLGLVMVDYFGLMTPDYRTSNTSQDLGRISMGLKALAKELAAPILLLAQLNREVEKRANKEPLLADLRDTGSLEQDADVVLMLHRPGASDDAADQSEAYVLIRKQRSGPCGKVAVHFDAPCTNFRDLGEG